MVLAASSPYFHKLFMETSCDHPIVFLKDVKAEQVRGILEYMYRGEVSVSQEQLPALLRVAELLRVKGMVEEEEEGGSGGDNADDTEEGHHHHSSNTVKKEVKEHHAARPRSVSPPHMASAPTSRSSSPMPLLRNSDGHQLLLPTTTTSAATAVSSSASNSNNTTAHTPTSSSSGPPPPHHLPPNFRPFLTPPGGGGGPANGGSPHHHLPHPHHSTPPFPMWPLPGLFPGAHSLFGGGNGPRDSGGRSSSPAALKEAARGRLNSGHQEKEMGGGNIIPPLMPRDSIDEKQVAIIYCIHTGRHRDIYLYIYTGRHRDRSEIS